jgi:hypothetical protein
LLVWLEMSEFEEIMQDLLHARCNILDFRCGFAMRGWILERLGQQKD